MTPDAQTQAEFRLLVRSWTPEQAYQFLRGIDEQVRNVHDLAREIIWQEHPKLAPPIRPVDIEAQDREARAANIAAQNQVLADLIEQQEALTARLAAAPPPFYTPAFYEQAQSDYTPCLLYTSPSPRDKRQSRMPSSA